MGKRQGCLFSPLLFTTVLEILVQTSQEKKRVITLGKRGKHLLADITVYT